MVQEVLLPPQVIALAEPVVADGLSPVELIGGGLLGAGLAAALVPAAFGALAGASSALIAKGLIASGTAGQAVAGAAFLLAVKQLRDWGLINYRPPGIAGLPAPGSYFPVGPGNDVDFELRWEAIGSTTAFIGCGGNPNFPAPPDSGPFAQSQTTRGIGFIVGDPVRTQQFVCETTNVVTKPAGDFLTCRRQSLPDTTVSLRVASTRFGPADHARTTTSTARNLRLVYGGVTTNIVGFLRDPIPEQVRPRPQRTEELPEPVKLPANPFFLPPIPVLPPPPEVVPFEPNETDRRLPIRPSIAPAPGLKPQRPPAVSPRRAPELPQGRPVAANGIRQRPPGRPTTTAPGTTFLPGGRPLPSNGPRPTPDGIAAELGKLEQKLEMLLKPDDPLSPLELLNRVIDQTENIKFLVEQLFPAGPYEFDAGFYQLSPICDRDSEGDLLPPRLAPWSGGQGEFTELRQRLDALAVLLQHHKDLKQPTCGPRGNGPASNVTVHFESE